MSHETILLGMTVGERHRTYEMEPQTRVDRMEEQGQKEPEKGFKREERGYRPHERGEYY